MKIEESKEPEKTEGEPPSEKEVEPPIENDEGMEEQKKDQTTKDIEEAVEEVVAAS